ncbi:MAG TPA: hypothetical protein VEC57_15720 [Candidatus Limnocylindrales bacterium]|nr:hypothetical protein [Candidatus Limnocylindrales bacterium]
MGITDEKLAALPRYQDSPLFDEVERAVLDLAVAMTSTPADVSEDLRQRLRRHLSEAEIVEVASLIAWENHRARFNRAFGVREMGFSDGAFCVLPERTPQ